MIPKFGVMGLVVLMHCFVGLTPVFAEVRSGVWVGNVSNHSIDSLEVQVNGAENKVQISLRNPKYQARSVDITFKSETGEPVTLNLKALSNVVEHKGASNQIFAAPLSPRLGSYVGFEISIPLSRVKKVSVSSADLVSK